MKIRFNDIDIVALITLLPFLEPAYLQVIHPIHVVYNALRIVSTCILFFLYLKNSVRPSMITLSLALSLGVMLVACQVTRLGNTATTLASYLPYLGLAMWFEYFINVSTDTALNVLCSTLDILVLINFMTIMAFPGGLYKIQSYQAAPYTCWFLGYKNPQVRFLLPYIALSLARNIIQHGRLSQLTYIRVGIAVFTTLFLKSTTGLVGTVLFFVLLSVFSNTGHGIFNMFMTRLLNIRMVFVVASVISVLFILFNFQNNLSFLIVNVLHKDLDLTDRIYVWENVIPYIRRSPIIGNGVLHAILSRKLIGASHAHNYLLNTLYNGGLVSLAAIVAGWFSAGKETQKYIDHKAIVILACVASAFCIMGISESLTSSVLLYPILAALCNAKKLTEAEWAPQTSEDIQKGQVVALCA